jgi:RNA polymerase sigma-70 factor, ECF subfamily
MGADEVNPARDRVLVAKAMAGLPETHRAVLSRAYYLGWATGKIAEDLRIPECAVKSQLHYALQRLRLILADMSCSN